MDIIMMEPQRSQLPPAAPAAAESIIQTCLRQNKEALITLPYESIANSLITTTTTTTQHHHQLLMTIDKNEEIKTSWPTNSERMEALLLILHKMNSHDSFRIFVDAIKSSCTDEKTADYADLAQKLVDEGTPYLLPPEILSKVFTYLTPKDLLITRLVSPKWKELSSPTLFSTHPIVLETKSTLDEFQTRCARNPEYDAFFKNFKTFSLGQYFRPYEFGQENLSVEPLDGLKFFTKFGPTMKGLILGRSLNESFAALIFTEKVQQTLNNLETLVIGSYLNPKNVLSSAFSISGIRNLVHLKLISPDYGTNGLISLMEKIFQSGGETLKSFKLQGKLCLPPDALPAGFWKPLFSRNLGLLSFDIGECTKGLDSNAMKDLTFPTTRNQTSQLVNLSFLADVTDSSQVNFHRMLASHSNSLKHLRINHYARLGEAAPNLDLTSVFPPMARLQTLALGHESFLKDLSFLDGGVAGGAFPKLKVLEAVVCNERQLGFGDTDTVRDMAVAAPVGQEEDASPQYNHHFHHGLKSLGLRVIIPFFFRSLASDFAKLLNTFPQLENLVFNQNDETSDFWHELSFDTVGTLELIGTRTEVVGEQEEGDLPVNKQIRLKNFREYYGGSFVPRLQKESSRLLRAAAGIPGPGAGAETRAQDQKLDAVLLVYRDYDTANYIRSFQKPVATGITALLREPVDERGLYKSVNIIKDGAIPTFLIIQPFYYAGPGTPDFHIPEIFHNDCTN